MKEAAGEANMTVVTIVLIAIVLGAGTLIVTNMMKGMSTNITSRCSQIGGYVKGGKCYCPGSTSETNVSGASANICGSSESVTF